MLRWFNNCCFLLFLCAPSFFVFTKYLLITNAQPYRNNSKCLDSETGRLLFVGESFTRPSTCKRLQCLGTLQLWEDNCQNPNLEGNCTRILHPNAVNKDYPHCCPQYECRIYSNLGEGAKEETRTYDHYGILRKTVIKEVVVLIKTTDGQFQDHVPSFKT